MSGLRGRAVFGRTGGKGERCSVFVKAAVGAVLAVWPACAGAATIYVDAAATGLGTGADWANARVHLQDALAAAEAGDAIHVAAGVYRPDKGLDRRAGDVTASFAMKEGVELLGGFPTGGGSLAQRDPREHPTILSGDLAGDDPSVDGPPSVDWQTHPARSDNVLHVVTATGVGASAVLDGFVVAGGNARGGALQDVLDASGGGLLALYASPSIRDCVFRHNSASLGGAAAFVAPGAEAAVLEDCVFLGNLADAGGSGGAVVNNSSDVRIHRGRFHGNQSYWGGAVDIASGRMEITGSVFTGNGASFGGAVNCNDSQDVRIVNCTFTANQALESGGAVRNENSQVDLCNSILWADGAAAAGGEIAVAGGGSTRVQFSNVLAGVQGAFVDNGASLLYDEANNISKDPVFVDPNGADGMAGTADDDWRLGEDSPCVDAGRNSDVPADCTIDLDGQPRFVDIPGIRNRGLGPGPIVDVGADEFAFAADINLDGVVSAADLSPLAAAWEQDCAGSRGSDCSRADIAADGQVDLADLLLLSEQWLRGL